MADRNFILLPGLLVIVLGLGGCTMNNEHTDLREFVTRVKLMPQKKIESLPPVRVYEPFTYEASGMRSPFDAPSAGLLQKHIRSGLKPDKDRKKQFLERFAFDAFLMVGTLTKTESVKGLVKVNNHIHLVSEGDYLGRNHGKITEITEKNIHVTELVPSGINSWIERPRRLTLE